MAVAKHAAVLPWCAVLLRRLCVALVVFLLQVDNKRSVDEEEEEHFHGSALSSCVRVSRRKDAPVLPFCRV